MAKCASCRSIILFGGKIKGDLRFCGERCRQRGLITITQQEIPEEILQEQIEEVHGGICPKCQGPGPVDVHYAYYIP